MQKSLNIFYGNIKFLSDIESDIQKRKESMQTFICEKLSFTYLTYSLKPAKENEAPPTEEDLNEKL